MNPSSYLILFCLELRLGDRDVAIAGCNRPTPFEAIRPILKKLSRSLGAGPWLAGLWPLDLHGNPGYSTKKRVRRHHGSTCRRVVGGLGILGAGPRGCIIKVSKEQPDFWSAAGFLRTPQICLQTLGLIF